MMHFGGNIDIFKNDINIFGADFLVESLCACVRTRARVYVCARVCVFYYVFKGKRKIKNDILVFSANLHSEKTVMTRRERGRK